MKSKELIRQLQEIDPSGEMQVVSGECDIFILETNPAYYDGKLVTLIRDKSKLPFYDIIGIKVKTEGKKINLKFMSAEDVIIEDWTAKVDLSECHSHFDLAIMREEGYKIALEYDKYPCKTCIHKPVNFYKELYEKCFDCNPQSEFKWYEK